MKHKFIMLTFQPRTSTAEPGPADFSVLPFSSSKDFTLQKAELATRNAPGFSVPIIIIMITIILIIITCTSLL